MFILERHGGAVTVNLLAMDSIFESLIEGLHPGLSYQKFLKHRKV
jgi:hypothetical protein